MKKNKLNRLLKYGILLFGIALLLTNCEKEFTQDVEYQQKSRFKIKTLNKEQTLSNKQLVKQLNKLKPKEKGDNQARTIYNSEYGFSIETDFVKYVEHTEINYHSYSFPITRDTLQTDNKVENLLLSLNTDAGTYDVFIVKYDFTKEEYLNIDYTVLDSRTTRYTPIDFDISVFNSNELAKTTTTYECNETWSYSSGTDHSGQLHGADCDCSSGGWVLESISCGFVTSAMEIATVLLFQMEMVQLLVAVMMEQTKPMMILILMMVMV